MTIHQCPKCELKFEWKTELDDHCRHDHPEFRHEYPAAPPPVAAPPPEPQRPTHPVTRVKVAAADLLRWLVPKRAHDEVPHEGAHFPR